MRMLRLRGKKIRRVHSYSSISMWSTENAGTWTSTRQISSDACRVMKMNAPRHRRRCTGPSPSPTRLGQPDRRPGGRPDA
ncbi:hypothetical protein QJS66_21520 [Kocuria rhizophila]|nr:hypothetical protein QJS66_21520 [Kocuria rhizophila]